jgi:hypothetical protein
MARLLPPRPDMHFSELSGGNLMRLLGRDPSSLGNVGSGAVDSPKKKGKQAQDQPATVTFNLYF